MCEKTKTRVGTLKTIVKGKSGKNENVSNVMNKSNTAVSITDLKLYHYQYSTSIGRGFNIQGVSKKSGISKFLTFCVIALVLLSLKDNNLCFHKIEFIVVIFSIIDFLSSKQCSRY
jgi:hypothetical protein